MTENTIDFTGVDPAEGNALGGGKYLMPGMYWITPVDVTFITSSKKGTPGMEMTFKATSSNPQYDGKLAKAKFWLTAGNMPRINYLHKAFYGKLIEKKFTSWEELVKYFSALINSKAGAAIKKPIVVGGSLSDDGTKIYSDLPYTGFLVTENEFEEGHFEPNGELFTRVLSSNTKVYNPDKPKSNSDFIGSEPETKNSWSSNSTPPATELSSDNEEVSDDLPF